MLDLFALQLSPAGRRLLHGEMIFDDPQAFLEHLQPSASRHSSAVSGSTDFYRVYAHQQPYLDYRGSVVAKVLALRDLTRRCDCIETEFVWIDTDRAGSDKLGLRMYWPTRQGQTAIRFAPPGCERREFRYISMDHQRLCQATDRLSQLVRQTGSDRQGALKRFDHMRPLLQTGDTLSHHSRRRTDFLFEETLGFTPTPVLVSDLCASGALTQNIELIVNRQSEFVTAYNERIRELTALGVAVPVKPLAHDYLPLFLSCSDDGTRMRTRLVISAGAAHATATDRAGKTSRFDLGQTRYSLGTLVDHGRWSPDVTLPILINDRYSGMVAGKSSALYMLVFRHVMKTVLGIAPIPLLIPSDWAPFPETVNSLFHAYIHGHTV